MSDFEDHSDARTVSVCLPSYDGRKEHYLSLLQSPPFILSLYHQAHSLYCLQVPCPRQGRTGSYILSHNLFFCLTQRTTWLAQFFSSNSTKANPWDSRSSVHCLKENLFILPFFNHPHAVSITHYFFFLLLKGEFKNIQTNYLV